MQKIDLKNGSGLVEILVAVSIFVIVLGSLIVASNRYLTGAAENLRSAKGAYIAEEGIEAIKIIRDGSWTTLSALNASTTYYLYWDTSSSTNNTWKATTTSSYQTVDTIFSRKFVLYDVYRDANGRIVSSGGTLDTNTQKVAVSVSWLSKTSTTTKTLSTYITNII